MKWQLLGNNFLPCNLYRCPAKNWADKFPKDKLSCWLLLKDIYDLVDMMNVMDLYYLMDNSNLNYILRYN
jgi:hypothetical protein